jgi:hypothetical protein
MIMNPRKVLFLALSLVFTSAWAQDEEDLGGLPEAKWTDVIVTDVNYALFSGVDSVVYNPLTGKSDTIYVDKGMKIYSEKEFQAKTKDRIEAIQRFVKRMEEHASRRAPAVNWYEEWTKEGKHERSAARLYSYKYPSVDADGNTVYLSALMGVPYNSVGSDIVGVIGAYPGMIIGGTVGTALGPVGTLVGGAGGAALGKRLFGFLIPNWKAKPDNVVIGCHVTITSNFEAPTSYNRTSSLFGLANFTTDTGMMLFYTRYDLLRQPCCLVIMPDYEGYGCTANRPHPYLYQELTARQVVDATRYGLALYNHYIETGDAAKLVDNWRSVCVGFSQGGSVSLATHKFIETNNLADELHFAGSVCGDGPYDPVNHLLYYMTDNGETYDGNKKTAHKAENVSMPIVMPLILKGMVDSNPYMRQHKITDYLTQNFLNTGVIDFIESKSKPQKEQFSTDDINKVFKKIKEKKVYNGKDIENCDSLFPFYDGDNMHGSLRYMLTKGCIEDFRRMTKGESIQNDYMKDLVKALESNNLTVGWKPQHRIGFYHTTYDTVVPYVNLLSFIRNQDGLSYYFHDSKRKYSKNAGVNPTHIVPEENADVYIYDNNCKKDHVPAGQEFFLLGRLDNAPDKHLMNWVLTGKK